MKAILILVAVALGLGLTACGGSQVSSKKVARFAQKCNLVVPPSAKGTAYQSVFSMDGHEMLRLEMPVADLEAFLSKSGLSGELGNRKTTSPATSYLGDFLPAHPKTFREGQKDLTGGFFLNVLVDEDDPAIAVVYLSWFGV